MNKSIKESTKIDLMVLYIPLIHCKGTKNIFFGTHCLLIELIWLGNYLEVCLSNEQHHSQLDTCTVRDFTWHLPSIGFIRVPFYMNGPSSSSFPSERPFRLLDAIVAHIVRQVPVFVSNVFILVVH